jgi:hypothetical protein
LGEDERQRAGARDGGGEERRLAARACASARGARKGRHLLERLRAVEAGVSSAQPLGGRAGAEHGGASAPGLELATPRAMGRERVMGEIKGPHSPEAGVE